jgi:DnaJ-class molecular chaperone
VPDPERRIERRLADRRPPPAAGGASAARMRHTDPVVEPDLGSDDPYAVLGLRATASWDEILTAHRSLARRFHPDKVATFDQVAREVAEEIMFKINWAYRELKVRRSR